MAVFDIAYKKTLQNEGGYSNSLYDRGKRTYRGISEKNFPDWKGWKIVDAHEPVSQNYIIKDANLDSLVYSFYRDNFWNNIRLSEIYNQSLSDELYDSGVNFGTGTSVRFLQQALNLLNRNQKDYKDIPADGVMGWTTITIANQCPYQLALIKTLNGLQFERYKEICERDKTQENNFIGWLKRVDYAQV
jgi:lysozyme family protein